MSSSHTNEQRGAGPTPQDYQAMIVSLQQELSEQAARTEEAVQAARKEAVQAAREEAAATATERRQAQEDAVPLPQQKLPQTEPFIGDRRAFPAWRMAIRAKLATDGNALGNNADQFNYVFSRLTGTALQLASPFYEHSVTNTTIELTALLFLGYLDTTYLDPNRQAHALVALRECQQKPNESFAAFLPRFEQLLAEAGMVMAEPSTKLNYLNGALNLALRLATLALAPPTKYGDWVQTL